MHIRKMTKAMLRLFGFVLLLSGISTTHVMQGTFSSILPPWKRFD